MASSKTSKSRGVFLLILLIVAIGGAGVYFKFFFKHADFSFAGSLEATKIDLSAQLPSTILEVKVREGDHVSAGQELVTLACEDIQVASKLANDNYLRNLKLNRVGTVSDDILDQFKNRKDELDVKLKWCSIVSPTSATVLSRYHEPGEWTSPGMKLLTLANLRKIWTYIYVPQEEVAHLKVGMKLKGIVPEIQNKAFEGTIIKINDEAEFTPKNVQTRSERTRLVYGIKVSFEGANEDETLKPGMTIEISLPKVAR